MWIVFISFYTKVLAKIARCECVKRKKLFKLLKCILKISNCIFLITFYKSNN